VAIVVQIGQAFAQPPEALIRNNGAFWAGEGDMIILNSPQDDSFVEAYALRLGDTKPKFLTRFNIDGQFTFGNRETSLSIHSPSQVMYSGSNWIFDFANNVIVKSISTSSIRICYFSFDPIQRTRFLLIYENLLLSIIEEKIDTQEQSIILSVSSFQLPNTIGIDGIGFVIFTNPKTVLYEIVDVEEFFSSGEVLSTEFANPSSPTLTRLYSGQSGLFPQIPEGFDGQLYSYNDFEIMRWVNVFTGDEERDFNVGQVWVSHNVNESTGNYYYHLRERVVEDPPDSGIYFTEIPVVISQDDFTSKTEVVFRIAYPTELPMPQDYVDHLAQVTEPVAGSPFPVKKSVSPVLFKDPDRNNDGQIDVADLVMRINEINSQTTRTLTSN
jgi:hypothetical protein